MQKYEKSFNIVLFHVKYVSLHSIKNNQEKKRLGEKFFNKQLKRGPWENNQEKKRLWEKLLH